MDKREIDENIAIARRYLDNLRMLLPDEKIMFDCYCFPPFRWKAFYAQVYSEDGIYRANCAYTRYRDHLGNESYSQPFTFIEKEVHSSERGDVFCKCIYPGREIIDKLLMCSKEYHSVEYCGDDRIVIDGITVGMRVYENGSVTNDIRLIDPEDDHPMLDAVLSFSAAI